jgi:hypothetical protein
VVFASHDAILAPSACASGAKKGLRVTNYALSWQIESKFYKSLFGSHHFLSKSCKFNRDFVPIVFGYQGIRTIVLTEILANAFGMFSQFMSLNPSILMKIIS